MGLSRPRRPLNWKYASVKRWGDPQRRIECRFAFHLDRLSAKPRRHSHEQVARRQIRPVSFHALLRDVFADPHECVRQDGGIDDLVRENRFRMNVRTVAALLDFDPSLFKRIRRQSRACCPRDCEGSRRPGIPFPAVGSCSDGLALSQFRHSPR